MKIAFLGDIALIGRYDNSKEGTEKVVKRFEDIVPLFENCDFVVANLESPLTDLERTREYKTLALRSPRSNAKVLKALGINVVSLSNNHLYDYGNCGVRDTLESLKEEKISVFGLDRKPLYLKKDEQVVALEGFCCLTTNAWHYDIQKNGGRLNTLTRESIDNFLQESIEKKAYPIVTVHWGEENTHYPRREHLYLIDEVMKNNKMTVVGHHPHVIQGIKSYKNGDAAFSLGNFCFDDCVSDKSNLVLKQTAENLKSIIMLVEIKGDEVKYQYVPIKDDGNKVVICEKIQDELKKYSEGIDTIHNIDKYDDTRKREQLQAQINRLGKRDFKWLLGHMNVNAVMSVMQRKNNQKNFKRLSKSFYSCETRKAIVYVGNFDKPDLNAAGKRVYGNALIFREMGYDVILIGKSKGNNHDKTITQELSRGITYVSFPDFGMIKTKKYIKWLENYLSRNNVKPVCFCRYGSPALAVFDYELYVFSRRINVPLVVDVVDWLSADGNNVIFNTVKTIDTWLEKACFNKKADGIIAISTYLNDYYKKNVKHSVIIPPIVERYIEPETSNAEKITIVYAGAPFRKGIRVKNVHKIKDRLDLTVCNLCKILDKGYNVVLKIYGITQDEYVTAFPEYKNIVESHKNNIIFFGRVSMEKVQEEVNKADYTILLREKSRTTMAGFPTKVVESISCSTPVITTDTSDIKDYIKSGYNGFIVNLDNLENDLVNIFEQPNDLHMQMKRNCYNEEVFQSKKYVPHMMRLLDLINRDFKM